MSANITSVNTMFDQFNAGLKTAIEQNAPYGFVHLDDFTTSTGVMETRMDAIKYMGVLSFCGATSVPSAKGNPSFDEALPVGELSDLYGETNIGGLGGYILSRAAQQETLARLGLDEIGGLRYSIRGSEKVLDSGLGSGFMVMGMMAQRGLEAIERSGQVLTTTQKLALLEASIGALPTAFAKMSNRDNRRTEVLYGLRVSGSYNAESARYELYQNDEDEFGFELTENGLIAQNFEKVLDVVNTQSKCPATSHPVFETAWSQICRNTVELVRGNTNV